MDEVYLDSVAKLDKQATFIAKKIPKSSPLFKELAPELEKLCLLVHSTANYLDLCQYPRIFVE